MGQRVLAIAWTGVHPQNGCTLRILCYVKEVSISGLQLHKTAGIVKFTLSRTEAGGTGGGCAKLFNGFRASFWGRQHSGNLIVVTLVTLLFLWQTPQPKVNVEKNFHFSLQFWEEHMGNHSSRKPANDISLVQEVEWERKCFESINPQQPPLLHRWVTYFFQQGSTSPGSWNLPQQVHVSRHMSLWGTFLIQTKQCCWLNDA